MEDEETELWTTMNRVQDWCDGANRLISAGLAEQLAESLRDFSGVRVSGQWPIWNCLAVAEGGPSTLQNWRAKSHKHGGQILYCQKTPPSSGIGASCRFPIVVVQHSTEFFSAADAPHSGARNSADTV